MGVPFYLKWVEERSHGPASLPLEFDTSQEQSPDNYRPKTVLSALYRLRAKFRFEAPLEWEEKRAPPELWGCRTKRGAEGAWRPGQNI